MVIKKGDTVVVECGEEATVGVVTKSSIVKGYSVSVFSARFPSSELRHFVFEVMQDSTPGYNFELRSNYTPAMSSSKVSCIMRGTEQIFKIKSDP